MLSPTFLWLSLLLPISALLPLPTLASMTSLPSSAGVIPASSQIMARRRSSGRVNRNPFKPRKDQPRPKYTVGGAGRQRDLSCFQTNPKPLDQNLIPLLPVDPSSSKLQFTLAAHPSLAVYIPQTSAKTVEFVLVQKDGEVVYQTIQQLPQTPAIVQVTLPQAAPALRVGEDYEGYITLICKGTESQPDDPFAELSIRRIEPDAVLANQLKQATGLDRVRLYGESGIWYDMVSTLMTLRQDEPRNTNATELWNALLQFNGLADLKDIPLSQPLPPSKPLPN